MRKRYENMDKANPSFSNLRGGCRLSGGGLAECLCEKRNGGAYSFSGGSGKADADCILVLGCGVRPDGTPSLMLTDRLETGIALYRAGVAEKLLMSGDHGTEDYDEVNTMKNIAKENGVPSADIFMDHAGFSTYDSVYRAKEIFCAKKVIIVSQKYHLPRALYVAEKLGLDAYGVAAADVSYRGQGYREVREMLARAKDFCNAALKRKPRLLGDAIPVSGNGDSTND